MVSRLPDFVGAAAVDPVFVLGLLVGDRLGQSVPGRGFELGASVLGVELAVVVVHGRTDEFVALDTLDRQLDAVVARLAQEGVGGQIAGITALAVDGANARTACTAETVVEGIFFGLPFEAVETFGHLRLAVTKVHGLERVGDFRCDQAVRLCRTRGIHELFRQTQAAFAVHGG
ncbi:MAG: hypothetical protein FD153_1611 [Rhodospirillaceae bacterium]|nr:MAG: hypothetical protein FD153_1611 [Rhodospirillaceae bacterium]